MLFKHPRHWAFSVSKDDINYVNNTAYDDKNNYMNNNLKTLYVPYQSQKVRFFRITITGNSYCGTKNRFDLNQVELYGTLFKNIFRDKTCISKRQRSISYFIVVTYSGKLAKFLTFRESSKFDTLY